MASWKSEAVQPREWTEQEAFRSGKSGYRIGVPISGNPFSGSLAKSWEEGYKLASRNDPYARTRKVDFSEDRPYERRDRNRRPSPRKH